jgi:ligand-binding sensor domain-containing protein
MVATLISGIQFVVVQKLTADHSAKHVSIFYEFDIQSACKVNVFCCYQGIAKCL